MAVKPLLVKILGDSTGAQAAFASLDKKMMTAGKKMTSAGRTMSRNVTLPIVAAGGAAVKLAIDYEQAFTRIAAVSNASASDIKMWRGEVLKMAGQTAQAPEELANALYFLASAGLKANQIMPVLEASAKASAVGLGETSDIAKLTANALNAYAKSGLTATQVTDTLVAAVKAGTAEPEEFSVALGRILPIASKAGVEFDQVTASLAQLSNIGLDVNEGVTALRAAMLSLLSPTDIARENLKKVGLTADQVRDTMANGGIIEVFELLEKATGGNIDTLRKIIGNVRGLAGVFGLTEQEASKVQKTFDDVAASTGELNQAMKKTEKDSAFKLQKMMAQLKVAGIELGTDLLPVVLKIAKQLGKLAKAFTSMSPAAQEAAIKFALFVAAAGPLLRIMGPLVGGVGKLAGSLRAVGAASTVAAGAKGAGGVAGAGTAASAAGGLFTIAAAEIIAFGTAMVRTKIRTDEAKQAFIEQGEATKKGKEAFENYADALQQGGQHLQESTSLVTNPLQQKALDELTASRKRYIAAVEGSVVGQKAYNRAIANGAGVLDALAAAERAVTDSIKEHARRVSVLRDLTNTASGATEKQRNKMSALVGVLESANAKLTTQEFKQITAAVATGKYSDAVRMLGDKVKGLKDKTVKVDADTKQAEENTSEMDRKLGLLADKKVVVKPTVDTSGLSSALAMFIDTAAAFGYQAGSAYAQGFKNANQVTSPSKVFIKIGKDIMAGFAIGLDQGQKPVRESFKSMEEYKKALVQHYSDAADKIREKFQPIQDFFKEFKEGISSGFEGFGDLASRFSGMKASEIKGKQITHFMAVESGKAKRLARALKKLARLGLNATTLSQIAAAGPEAVGLAEAMLRGGGDRRMVNRTNKAQGRIDSYARQTAQVAGNQINVTFQGNVYGFDDFKRKVMRAVNEEVKKKRSA